MADDHPINFLDQRQSQVSRDSGPIEEHGANQQCIAWLLGSGPRLTHVSTRIAQLQPIALVIRLRKAGIFWRYTEDCRICAIWNQPIIDQIDRIINVLLLDLRSI